MDCYPRSYEALHQILSLYLHFELYRPIRLGLFFSPEATETTNCESISHRKQECEYISHRTHECEYIAHRKKEEIEREREREREI